MTNKKTLEVGFIGGGLSSAIGYCHNLAVKLDGRFDLVAGCFSSRAEVNKSTALSWGVSPDRTYENWEDMLSSEKGNLDAFVVLTETPSHYKIVKTLLENKVPVICEKSLTATLEESKSLDKLVNDMRGFLAVTYNYSGYPLVRGIRELIQKGTLGRVTQIHAVMPQEGYLRVKEDGSKATIPEWRLQESGIIPTLSLDLGVHVHQMIYFLTGARPKETIGIESSMGHFDGVIDNCLALAKYEHDIAAQIWFSKSALGHKNGFEFTVYGTEGSINWLQTKPEEAILTDRYGKKSTVDSLSLGSMIPQEDRYNRFKPGHPAGYIEAFANYYWDVADALENYKTSGKFDSQYVFGTDVAVGGLRFFEAVTKSNVSRTWESV